MPVGNNSYFESEAIMQKLGYIFAAVTLTLFVSIVATVPITLSAQQSDPVYVFCSASTDQSHDIYYSLIFNSDYGLSVDRYKEPFEKWLLKTNHALAKGQMSSHCFPGHSQRSIMDDRYTQMAEDRSRNAHPIEVRWPE
jgi:hypothetical protein